MGIFNRYWYSLSKTLFKARWVYFWIKNNMPLPDIVNNIEKEDYVIIIRNECFHRIKYEDFKKDLCCEKCRNELSTDHPIFRDVEVFINNRVISYSIGNFRDRILQSYFSPNQKPIKHFVITGGELQGLTYNDIPVTEGLTLPIEDLVNLKYTARDIDKEYTQEIYMDVYDIDGVKARRI